MFDVSLAWWALPLFFLVALLYASVGHGGASGYLALFALLSAAQSAVLHHLFAEWILFVSFVAPVCREFHSGRVLRRMDSSFIDNF